MIESETHRRRWLCIAYAFPPIHRSGTQRTLSFVKHLDEAGWDATVLTVHPRDEQTDDALLSELPARTEVLRSPWVDPLAWAARLRRVFRPRLTKSTPLHDLRDASLRSPANGERRSFVDWCTRLLHVPDSRIGWIPQAVWRGLRAIQRRKPEIILSTSPYASAHLIAMILGRITRRPWIADFRDPWCANPYRDLRYASLRRWDAWLERAVVRNASQVVCNTSTAASDFVRRFPKLTGRCKTIPNGIDFERYDDVKPTCVGRPGEFVLLHSGQFYGPRSPQPLLRAFRRIAEQVGEAPRKIRLVLLGPGQYDGRPLKEIVDEMGLGDKVDILGPRPHGEALSLMAGTDALVLVGGAGHGGGLQIPNKLYEYLALRRPILALLPNDNPARDVLEVAHADALISEPNDEAGIVRALTRLADPLRSIPEGAWSGVPQFDRSRRAKELLEIFDRLTSHRSAKAYSANQRPCKTNGFVVRSRPMVVSGP